MIKTRTVEIVRFIDCNSEIDKNELFDYFFEYPERTVYVTDSNEVSSNVIVGIITQGDFKRYYLNHVDKLWRDKFTAYTINENEEDKENEEKAVKEIFKNNPKIMCIPILNKRGEFVREYYKNLDSEKNFELIEDMVEEAAVSCYDINLFLFGTEFSQGQLEKSQSVMGKTNGKVLIKERIKKKELLKFYKEGKKIIVYFANERNALICKTLDECKIEYKWIWSFYYDVIKQWGKASARYNTIGIIKENQKLINQVVKECNVVELSIDDFLWSKEEKCYCYKGNVEIEAIFTYAKIFDGIGYVKINNVYVPLISIIFDINSPDADIACNVVPKLQANGIKCLVIENCSEDLTDLEDADKIADRKFYCLDEGVIGAKEENTEELKQDIRKFVPIEKDGYFHFTDVYSQYVNYVNGERYTIGNPENYKNTIYLFGPCFVRGGMVSDSNTMSSLMRNYISDDYYIKNMGSDWNCMVYDIRNQVYKEGDIVVIFSAESTPYEMNGIKMYSIKEVYKKIPKLSEAVWDNLYHVNYLGMRYVAEELSQILNRDFLAEQQCETGTNRVVSFGSRQTEVKEPIGLRIWLDDAKKNKKEVNGVAGAIVMNCNPFTKGHRYLIEKAREKVDILYIFIVQEDKSFFKFEDRLKMVQMGVSDLENVIVIPSGKYMISAVTLPGYFEKETNPDLKFDATDDLDIFGSVIAKEFGISVRFAGEEPTDAFTRRYNKYMSEILPKHNVKFVEIPRKELNGDAISASRVRKYMKERRYEAVKELVLPVVYKYLEEHYFE